MLEEGDKAIMQRAFAEELYPALDKTEERMTKTITEAVNQHHVACNYREIIPRFELTISQVKNETEQAKLKATAAAEQAAQIKIIVDAKLNQVWGGWKVLLVLIGIFGFIMTVLEFLAIAGIVSWHK